MKSLHLARPRWIHSVWCCFLNGLLLTEAAAVTPAKDAPTVEDCNGGDGFGFRDDGFPVASFAQAVLAADVNGDGIDDVIVGHRQRPESFVSIALSLGDGTFELRNELPTGNSLTVLAAADLDGDGNGELIVGGLSGVRVFESDGRGVFDDGVELDVRGAAAIAVADLSGDQFPDLLLPDLSAPDQILLLLNRGDGTFAPAQPLKSGERPRSVTPTDLDQDGDVDFAVPNSASGTLSIFLNTGDGAFPRTLDAPLAGMPSSASVGDVDGDADPDVFVAGLEPGVRFVENKGGGSLGEAASFDDAARVVVVDDFDQNGLADAALWDRERLVIASNRGDGTFQRTEQVTQTFGLLAPGDFDDDGDADLVFAGGTVDKFQVLWNGTRSILELKSTTVRSDGRPHGGTLADLDGDGDFDAVTANGDGRTVITFQNRGDGTFSDGIVAATHENRLDFTAAGDLDADGDTDLAVASPGEVVILRNDSTGIFPATATDVLPAGDGRVHIADLDGDGLQDLLNAAVSGAVVVVYFNADQGSFSRRLDLPVSTGPVNVAAADVDGDGDVDVVSGNRTAIDVSVLLNGGDGTFASSVSYPLLGRPSDLVTGDFDGDDDVDIATSGAPDSANVILNAGDGSFGPPADYPLGSEPTGMVTADLNRDGALDLATANQRSSRISILLGNGDGVFERLFRFPVGDDLRVIVAGDLDLDGDPDLLTANRVSGDLTVLINETEADCNERRLLFRRGDAGADGTLDIADVLTVLRFLFTRTASLSCRQAADADDDGKLSLLDALRIAALIFGRESALPSPFPGCGRDPSADGLGCAAYPPCLR